MTYRVPITFLHPNWSKDRPVTIECFLKMKALTATLKTIEDVFKQLWATI